MRSAALRLSAIAAVVFCSAALGGEVIDIATAGEVTFSREALTGYLSVRDESGPLPIDLDTRINFYLQGAFEFDGKAYVLVYNTATNVPSGRRLSRGAEGNDLYSVDLADGVPTFEMVASIPVGIDTKLRTAPQPDGSLVACATTDCLLLTKDWFGKIAYTAMKPPASSEIVELSGPFVLVQRVFNDQFEELPPARTPIFSVCRVEPEMQDCAEVPADQVPYDLQADGSYSVADEPEILLRFDYERLGLAEYGATNLEARLAWSNVYFLTGLANLYNMAISPEFREEVRRRLISEIEALSRLTNSAYPGLKARRYSMDREPLDFLLHYGRVAKVIELARPIVGDSLTDAALAPLLPQLRSPTITVEAIAGHELRYRAGMPFWADGSNVPWNYQSGWIEGVALTGIPDPLRERVTAMLTAFVDAEGLGERPDKWSYAGGDFNDGWADGLSTNTPTWAGQAQINIPAHISYRSMDALAVLAAAEAGIDVLPDFETYAADLIERGYLYPFVNAGLETPAEIPFHIARHYARSSLPWHFQNQVWALFNHVDE